MICSFFCHGAVPQGRFHVSKHIASKFAAATYESLGIAPFPLKTPTSEACSLWATQTSRPQFFMLKGPD
jgi:hypothetical protein